MGSADARRAREAPPGARRGGALRRLLGPRRARRSGGRAMSAPAGKVLHVQKVAGISGSEAHLLQLLPGLRERGWDVDFLMLHEDEPGAWEFARALRDRGVPLDDVRLRADVDPIAYAEVGAFLARRRPRVLHTHLVHADVYGQIAGAMARTPLRLSTKHGFNWFREGRFFGARRSLGRVPGSRPHRHLARPRALSRRDGGIRRGRLRDRPLRDLRPGRRYAVRGAEPRLLCVGRLIPVKGHLVLLRALAQARARVPELVLDIAGSGPLEPALRALRARAQARRRGPLPRLRVRRCRPPSSSRRSSSCPPSARGSGWSRSRPWNGRDR